MANFYITREMIKGSLAVIDGEEARHIKNVLRMKKGDKLVLCDGEGIFYDAVIAKINEKTVEAEVLSSYQAPTEPKIKITLYQGVPKNPKLETIVQKATEIGVVRIVPVDTVRAVAKIDKEAKIDRLRKIAREAAKQSKRAVVPVVTPVMNFKEAVLEASKADIKIIAYEDEKMISIKEALKKNEGETISVLIGPEGGFEEKEVELAKSMGIASVTLGKRILRTETAGLAVSAVILYEKGEME